MALIDIDGVSKTYALGNDRELTAIDRIALSIGEGKFVSIIGPSGCGKSTLLRMIGGFVPCSAGEIRARGAAIREPGPERRHGDHAISVFLRQRGFHQATSRCPGEVLGRLCARHRRGARAEES
jgi:ABC-type lipoprotein export system ATPase subunit